MGKKSKLDIDEDVLLIDKHDLDEEWVNQPTTYFKYASMLADAKFTHEEAKADLALTEAEVASAIRKKPSNYGINKLTESAVKEAIPQQAEYKMSLEEVNQAKHKVDILQALVTSLDHKKRALEKIVDLQLSNYYSTPVSPDKEHSVEMNEIAKKRIRSKAKIKNRRADDDDD